MNLEGVFISVLFWTGITNCSTFLAETFNFFKGPLSKGFAEVSPSLSSLPRTPTVVVTLINHITFEMWSSFERPRKISRADSAFPRKMKSSSATPKSTKVLFALLASSEAIARIRLTIFVKVSRDSSAENDSSLRAKIL